jgi:putative transposase
MTEYRHGPHSVFEIHLHLVWVTKYRKPVLAGAVGVRVRDLIREICGASEVLIIKGHVSKDHVHLLVSIPPQVHHPNAIGALRMTLVIPFRSTVRRFTPRLPHQS